MSGRAESGPSQPKLVILDRDGVINKDSPEFIKSEQEWHALPGSLEAIARLNAAGWKVAVATNQSGIGRGLYDHLTLAGIHRKMLREAAACGGRIAVIEYCPHKPDDGCECRKPAPGLLLRIAERLGQPLHGVPCIGDSRRDLEAAAAVGARPILVRSGNGATLADSGELPAGTEVYGDLADAVAALIAERDGSCPGDA